MRKGNLGIKLDLTNKRFGNLVAIYEIGRLRGGVLWHCNCDCGMKIVIPSRNLVSGNTKSCGCYKAAQLSMRMKKEDKIVKGNLVWKNYRRNAIKRDMIMLLTKTELLNVAALPCKYCGVHPHYYHGIDRIDNEKGYTLDNVVPCCWMCNRAKGDSSLMEFLEWSKRLYEYNKIDMDNT